MSQCHRTESHTKEQYLEHYHDLSGLSSYLNFMPFLIVGFITVPCETVFVQDHGVEITFSLPTFVITFFLVLVHEAYSHSFPEQTDN